jgi:type IV pilus assembly protein PilO
MALIPSDPKHQRALIAIVLTASAFYGYWEYVYSPAREQLDGLLSRVEVLRGQNRNAQITAARGGGDLEERTALYESHVRVLERLIPASDEVPQLLRSLASQARALDLDLNLINPEPDEVGEFYTKRVHTLTVIGEYHDVGRFLTAIASLPRIITPVGLDLAQFDEASALGLMSDYESPVRATFRIETYIVPRPDALAPELGGEEVAG